MCAGSRRAVLSFSMLTSALARNLTGAWFEPREAAHSARTAAIARSWWARRPRASDSHAPSRGDVDVNGIGSEIPYFFPHRAGTCPKNFACAHTFYRQLYTHVLQLYERTHKPQQRQPSPAERSRTCPER